MPDGCRFLIENCLFIGAQPLAGGDGAEHYRVSIQFARNTVVATRISAFQVIVLMTPKMTQARPAAPPLCVNASENIFDVNSVLWFGQQVEKGEPLRGIEAEAFLKRLLNWRDDHNLYAPGANTLSWWANQHIITQHGPKNLTEWNRFWRQGISTV
jgi:hypothetical protein